MTSPGTLSLPANSNLSTLKRCPSLIGISSVMNRSLPSFESRIGLRFGLADVDLQVAAIAIERDDHFGVFFELVFLIDAAAREDPEPPPLFVFIRPFSLPSLKTLLPTKSTFEILILGPSVS
jgi:hypothetical protein